MLESPKFCFAPFTNIFIKGNGAVYLCCSNQQDDVCFGNLLHDSVDEILYGARVESLRRQAAKLELPCNSCVYGHKSNNPKRLSLENIFLPFSEKNIGKIQVELGYFCPSSCSFCNQPHHIKNHLPYEKLKELIIRTNPKQIQLQGGEAFYVTGARDFFLWLGENKLDARIFMHTNCMIPSKELPLILDVIDTISLNLYGMTSDTFYFTTGMNFSKAISFVHNILIAIDSQRLTNRARLKLLVTPTTLGDIPIFMDLVAKVKADNNNWLVRLDFSYDFLNTPREKILNLFRIINRRLGKPSYEYNYIKEVFDPAFHALGFKREVDLPSPSNKRQIFDALKVLTVFDHSRKFMRTPVPSVSESCTYLHFDANFTDYQEALEEFEGYLTQFLDYERCLVFTVYDFNLHEIPLIIDYARSVGAARVDLILTESAHKCLARYRNEFEIRIYKAIVEACNRCGLLVNGLDEFATNFIHSSSEDGKTTASFSKKEIIWYKERLHTRREVGHGVSKIV